MNAIYDDNGRGYDWLHSQLKRLHIQHVFSGPMFRHHNCIHRQQIEPYLVTSTASTKRQHAIHGSTLCSPDVGTIAITNRTVFSDLNCIPRLSGIRVSGVDAHARLLSSALNHCLDTVAPAYSNAFAFAARNSTCVAMYIII